MCLQADIGKDYCSVPLSSIDLNTQEHIPTVMHVHTQTLKHMHAFMCACAQTHTHTHTHTHSMPVHIQSVCSCTHTYIYIKDLHIYIYIYLYLHVHTWHTCAHVFMISYYRHACMHPQSLSSFFFPSPSVPVFLQTVSFSLQLLKWHFFFFCEWNRILC